MILIALLALEVALGAYYGMRSGRNRRRLDWVSFYMYVWAISGVAASGSAILYTWINWYALDKWQEQTIAKGKTLRIAQEPEYDEYEVDYGGGSTGRVRRFPFNPCLNDVCSLGIFCGASVGVFSILARKITIKKMGSRLLPGHCETCGYNLTENVSGICPECGTALETTAGPEQLS